MTLEKVNVLNLNKHCHSWLRCVNYQRVQQSVEKPFEEVVSHVVAFLRHNYCVYLYWLPETGGVLCCTLTPRPWRPSFQWHAIAVLWHGLKFFSVKANSFIFACSVGMDGGILF